MGSGASKGSGQGQIAVSAAKSLQQIDNTNVTSGQTSTQSTLSTLPVTTQQFGESSETNSAENETTKTTSINKGQWDAPPPTAKQSTSKDHPAPATNDTELQTVSTANDSGSKKQAGKIVNVTHDLSMGNTDWEDIAQFFKMKKETPEERTIRKEAEALKYKEKSLGLIDQVKKDFPDTESFDSSELSRILRELNRTYLSTGSAPSSTLILALHNEIVDYLTAQEVDEKLFTILMKYLSETRKSETCLSADNRKCMDKCISTLINMTDASIPLSEKVCQKPGFLECMSETMLYHGVFKEQMDQESNDMVYSMTALVYNCSLRYSNRMRLRDVGLVWILKRLMARGYKYQGLTSTLALAGILDEEESKFFQSEMKSIALLASLLSKAVSSKDKRHDGYSAKGLASACGRLAGNDVTNKVLVEVGMLDSLVALCRVGDYDEQKEALGALWALAFDDGNKDQMLEQDDLIDTLVKLRECPDESVKMEAVNTLWTLRDKLSESSNPEFKTLGKDLSTSTAHHSSSSAEELESGKHIMISYSWANKITVFKVLEELEQNGYRVWIDRNEMKGSIIDSIAEGVENADAMLMCVSQKYKTSKYCRAEAEYAFTRDINIIPLLMESDFNADGWLGLIKGAKKHFDFGRLEYFEMSFPNLVKELGQQGKGLSKTRVKRDTAIDDQTAPGDGVVSDQGVPNLTTGHGAVVYRPVSNLVNWSSEEVRKWLEDNGCYRAVFQKLTGRQLLFLRNLEKKAPEYFYSYLKTDFKMKDIEGLANLVYAMESL